VVVPIESVFQMKPRCQSWSSSLASTAEHSADLTNSAVGGETNSLAESDMFFATLRSPWVPRLLCVFLAAVLIASAASLLVVSPDLIVQRTWKKHYTLYIEASEDTEQMILRIAEDRFFEGVVSRYTAKVSFNTFAGFETIPIQQLPERLDALDPRFDPYLKRVGNLFKVVSGGQGETRRGFWEVAYLRTERNVLSSYLHLSALLKRKGLRWRLLEFDPLDSSIRLLLFLAYCAVIGFLASNWKVRLSIGLASLPWMLLVLLCGFSSLLAFFLILPAWVHLLEWQYERWRDGLFFPRDDLKRNLFSRPAISAVVATGLGMLLLHPGALPGALISVLGGAVASALVYRFLVVEGFSRAHPPFQPLPILGRFHTRRRTISREVKLHILLAVIVLGSYPALRLGTAFSKPVSYKIQMQPIRSEPRDLSWKALAALSGIPRGNGIPNLADYLSHRAYQESLIFGRSYTFPRMGERLVISDYHVDSESSRIQKTFRVVKQFKESWLRGTLGRAAPGSLPRLFADQEIAGTVETIAVTKPIGAAGFGTLLVLIFLFSFLVPQHYNLTAFALYATRSLTLRRH